MSDLVEEEEAEYYIQELDEDDDVVGLDPEDMFQVRSRLFLGDNDDNFNKDFDSKLIRCVKEYPVLYNNKHRSFDELVEDAWTSVATQVSQSVQACQYRWRRLRQYYAKERAKRERPDVTTKKLWLLYDEMDYLAPYVLKRKIFRRPETQIVVRYQNDPLGQNSDQEAVVYETEELNSNDYFDIQLIESIKNHPCIYNNEYRKIKNCEVEAWNDIATHLGQSTDECQSRYRRLRQYYAKERAKREVFGDGFKKWALYDVMSFLEPFIKKRMTARLLSQNLEESMVQSLSNDDSVCLDGYENDFINEDFDMKLLEAIKDHPCVYDPKQRTDEITEAEAWNNIADAVLQTVEVCQCRYTRLRQYYAKERHRREMGEPKRWPLFEHVHFLGPFIKKRKLMKNLDLGDKVKPKASPKKKKEEIEKTLSASDQGYYFNDDFDIKLLKYVKDYPCIFNFKRTKSQEDVDAAWSSISLKLETPANLCERRFIRLRQYYAKERQKRIKKKPHREWPLFEMMEFLEPYIKKRNCAHVKRGKTPMSNSISESTEPVIEYHDYYDDSKDFVTESDSRTSYENSRDYKELVKEELEDFDQTSNNFVINVDEDLHDDTNNLKLSNKIKSIQDSQKNSNYQSCDEEKLKELISSSATDVATSFYWPDFTMTVIKKKKSR